MRLEGVVKEVVKSTEPAASIVEEVMCERHLLDDVVGKVVSESTLASCTGYLYLFY